jgi:hypothetical protein
MDTFPERPRTALAIVACESGFEIDVRSKHILSYGREESYGLFQIHARVHHETAMRLGLTEYKTDPEQNAKMARYIYESAGHSFQPWTCYSKNLIAMR